MAKTKLIDALRKRFATPQLALEALGLDAATIAMDATIPEPKKPAITGDTKESTMTKTWSPTGLAAMGALNLYLKPRLAQDASISLPFLKGITAKNFHTSRAQITKDIKALCAGKIATDADIDDIGEVLDQIDALADKGREALGEPAEGDPDLDTSAMPEAKDDDLSELVEKIKALSPEDKARLDEMIQHTVEPSDPAAEDETEEEKAMRERSAADARARLGRDETPEEKAKREADFAKARDTKRASDKKARDEAEDRKRANDRRAHDAAIAADTKKQVTEAIEGERINQRAISAAERFVRPWVGELASDLAFDSAPDVYKKALEMRGIEVKGMHPDAYRSILEHLPRAGEKTANNGSGLAHDAALPRGIKSASERFAGAGNIRVMG